LPTEGTTVDPQEIALLAAMGAGTVLAVYGYTRQHAAGNPAHDQGHGLALLRLIADLLIGLVQLLGFAAFVFGPRHAKVPDPLTRDKARDVLTGRHSTKSRPGGSKR
jgi:hypothetical protein